MSPRATIPEIASAPSRFMTPWIMVAAATGALLAAAVVLWVHYGTAVFYETILSGIGHCL